MDFPDAFELVIGGMRVVGSAKPAIEDSVGGATIDDNLWACVAQILGALCGHGLILI